MGPLLAAMMASKLAATGVNAYADRLADKERQKREKAIAGLQAGLDARVRGRAGQNADALTAALTQGRAQLANPGAGAKELAASFAGAKEAAPSSPMGTGAMDIALNSFDEGNDAWGKSMDLTGRDQSMHENLRNRDMLGEINQMLHTRDERATAKAIRDIMQRKQRNAVGNLKLMASLLDAGGSAMGMAGAASGGGEGAGTVAGKSSLIGNASAADLYRTEAPMNGWLVDRLPVA